MDVRGPDVFQFDPGDSLIGAPDRVMDFQSRFDNIELDIVPNGSFQNFVMAGGVFADEAEALEQANILLNERLRLPYRPVRRRPRRGRHVLVHRLQP